MRTLILSLLFATLVCNAQDTNLITRKLRDLRPGRSRVESFFRGDQRVMVEFSRPNTQGIWTVTSRAYFAGGKTVAIESDEDLDGFFETFIVFRSCTEDIEAFTRHRDGLVQPVSAQALQALKKQDAAFSELAQKAFGKDADPNKLEDAVRETLKKLREAEREKTDEKK